MALWHPLVNTLKKILVPLDIEKEEKEKELLISNVCYEYSSRFKFNNKTCTDSQGSTLYLTSQNKHLTVQLIYNQKITRQRTYSESERTNNIIIESEQPTLKATTGITGITFLGMGTQFGNMNSQFGNINSQDITVEIKQQTDYEAVSNFINDCFHD